MTATKGFRRGYFPCRTRQRIATNAAKPSRTSGLGLGFKEGFGHPGHRGAGVATGSTVGHEWQPRHSGHYDGLGR